MKKYLGGGFVDIDIYINELPDHMKLYFWNFCNFRIRNYSCSFPFEVKLSCSMRNQGGNDPIHEVVGISFLSAHQAVVEAFKNMYFQLEYYPSGITNSSHFCPVSPEKNQFRLGWVGCMDPCHAYEDTKFL